MLNQIKERMMHPTSAYDIKHMMGDNIKITLYEDLRPVEDIHELFDHSGRCVILFPDSQFEKYSGHWTCCFIRPGSTDIEYFDSYGDEIDQPLGWQGTWAGAKRAPTHIPTYLSDLLLRAMDGGYRVNWNETAFQNLKLPTQTCGLWTCFRLKDAHLTEAQFRKKWYTNPKAAKVDPDMLIADMALKLYPGMKLE